MQGIYNHLELIGTPTDVLDTNIVELALNKEQKSKSAYAPNVSFVAPTSPAPKVTPPRCIKQQPKIRPNSAKRTLNFANTTYTEKANAAFLNKPATSASAKRTTFDNKV